MNSLRFVVTLVASIATLAGCAATSTPRIRVARDLGCTADHTEIARIDDRRWQVSGCGRTAVYLCTYPVRDCWREGEIYDAASGASPTTPAVSAK